MTLFLFVVGLVLVATSVPVLVWSARNWSGGDDDERHPTTVPLLGVPRVYRGGTGTGVPVLVGDDDLGGRPVERNRRPD